MDKQVAIVGCGPSGILAAHAAALAGAEVKIYAPKFKSFIGGAQYIHREVCVPSVGPEVIRYLRYGTAEQYESKIYGKLPDGLETSWDRFPDQANAWPMQLIYDLLWISYSPYIEDCELSCDQVLDLRDKYDVVISSAPLPKLLPDAHYETEEVWVTTHGDAPKNTIVYDGRPESIFYRTSSLFGHNSTEVSSRSWNETLSKAGFIKVSKPLRTEAHLPGILQVGRYGTWKKGVLADESFYETTDLLRSM